MRPGGDGRVCRIVDGTDGKQEESSADHLEVKLEQTSLEARLQTSSKPLPTHRVSEFFMLKKKTDEGGTTNN